MKLKATLITLLAVSACVLFAFSTNKASRSSGLRGLQEVSIDTSNPAAPSIKISNVNQLVQALLAVSAYSNSTFDTITINSFSKVDSDNETAYQAQLAIENDQGVSINALVTGNFDQDSNTIVFSASEYQVAEGGNPSDASDVSDDSDSDNNSTAPVYNITWPAGYVALSADDVANNEQANAALQFGINALIQTGIAKYQIPAASPQYNLTNFMGAAYKNASYGVNFKFATNLTNELNYKVDANITVYYLKSSQSFMLAGYSFKSHGYPKSALPPAPVDNNSTTNNTIPDNSTIPSNSTTGVPDNSTVVIPDNSTVPDNSTIPDNSTVVVPDNSTSPSNSTVIPPNNSTNSTQPSSNVTSDGYTVNKQWAKDSTAKTALRFGVDSLVNWMISAKKIPAANPHYNITEVVWAGIKKQVVGTYYKFTVKAINADYVHLNANVTVFYRYSTKKFNLAGYSYNAFNFSKSDIAKTTQPVVVSNSTSSANNTSTAPVTVAPVDNSTVIADPTPVAGDNSTVIDSNAAPSNDSSTVVDNGDAVVAGN